MSSLKRREEVTVPSLPALSMRTAVPGEGRTPDIADITDVVLVLSSSANTNDVTGGNF